MFHSYRILLGRLYFVARVENYSFGKGKVRNRIIASTYLQISSLRTIVDYHLKSSSLRHGERLQPHHQLLPCTAMDVHGSQPF